MENILVKGKSNISKIFILTLIFIGVISALSMVNAAEETINLIVGKSVTKTPLKTEWGSYNGINYLDGDRTIVDIEETGNNLKGMNEGKVSLKFKALKEGQCKIQVKYCPSFWEGETEIIYVVNVESVKPEAIKVLGNPMKNVYSPGEKFSLDGMRLNVTMNDGTTKLLSKDEFNALVLEPSVAPKTAGDYEIKVTYKGIATKKGEGIKIHVNPPKQNDDNKADDDKKENNQSNNNKPNIPNNNPSSTTKPSTSTTTTAPQYSDGKEVKKDDVIKMAKGNSWNVYSDSNCKTIKTYIQSSKGLKYKVEDINGNFVKLSQNGKEVGYIKWYNTSTGAMSYFSKVEEVDNNNATDTDKKENTTTDKNETINSEELTEALNLMTELITKILTSLLESLSTACK